MRSQFPSHPGNLGLVTSLGAGLSVLLLCAIFEVIVPLRAGTSGTQFISSNNNFRAIILYAAAGGCHTLLCAFGTLLLGARLRAEETPFALRKMSWRLGISFLLIIGTVLVACYWRLAVVEQSYFHTMRPLSGDARFGILWHYLQIPQSDIRLQVFALVPLTFVMLGISFSILACFWTAHKAVDLVRRARDIKEAEIVELKREIAQLLSLLSIVFTSSCISTITFLQLGRDWIEKGPLRDSYVQNGYAMAIFWSACFTIIMLMIVLVPLFWVGWRTLHIRRQAKHAGDKSRYFDPFYDVFSYGFLSKSAAATLMPIVTSSIAAVIGS